MITKLPDPLQALGLGQQALIVCVGQAGFPWVRGRGRASEGLQIQGDLDREA